MADRYLIVVTGQGDTTATVVDKATFDWLSSPPEFPEGKSGMKDPKAPKWLLEKRKAVARARGRAVRIGDSDPNEAPVNITTGSWENDRALACFSMDPYKGQYSRIKDALADVRSNGDEIADQYHGLIY